MTSNGKKMDELLELAGGDEMLLSIIGAAVHNGVIDSDGNDLSPSKSIENFGKKYGKYLLEHEKILEEEISFKIGGNVSLDDIKLDVFNIMHESAKIIADAGYAKARLAGLKANRSDYNGSIAVSLKTGSFEVGIKLPAIENNTLGEDIDNLRASILGNDIGNTVFENLDKFTANMEKLLDFPEISSIKISKGNSTDLEKSPEIKKEHRQKISAMINKKQLVLEIKAEPEPFNEKVIIFATNTKDRTFEGFAKEHKIFKFDCSNPEDKKSWWAVINNQIEDIASLEKASIVVVSGYHKTANSIFVRSVEVQNKEE